jgi:hypothetical protein
MHDHSAFLKRASLGAAGGLLGTLAVQALMRVKKQWLPEAMPPIRQEPGEFMVERAEELLPQRIRRHVPEAVEAAAKTGLGLGYGMAFGALYAAVRPRGGGVLVDGALLGIGCWAAGYLGWLRAVGLMPPVSGQTATQIAGPVADHLAYGVVTAAAYDWLCDVFDPAVPAEVEFGSDSSAPTPAMAGAPI